MNFGNKISPEGGGGVVPGAHPGLPRFRKLWTISRKQKKITIPTFVGGIWASTKDYSRPPLYFLAWVAWSCCGRILTPPGVTGSCHATTAPRAREHDQKWLARAPRARLLPVSLRPVVAPRARRGRRQRRQRAEPSPADKSGRRYAQSYVQRPDKGGGQRPQHTSAPRPRRSRATCRTSVLRPWEWHHIHLLASHATIVHKSGTRGTGLDRPPKN